MFQSDCSQSDSDSDCLETVCQAKVLNAQPPDGLLVTATTFSATTDFWSLRFFVQWLYRFTFIDCKESLTAMINKNYNFEALQAKFVLMRV